MGVAAVCASSQMESAPGSALKWSASPQNNRRRRRALLKQADVHPLPHLPTGILIRSLPLAQPFALPVPFFAPSNSGLRPRRQSECPLFDRKPAAEKPWTEKLWIYDLRTNKHFTLKENPLKRSDLDDFVACYNPKNRHERKESDRFKSFSYEDLLKRDKLNLDTFWLKDE